MGKKIKFLLLSAVLLFGSTSPAIAQTIQKQNLDNVSELEELKQLEAERNELLGAIGSPLYAGGCGDAATPYELAFAKSDGSFETIACYATQAEAASAMKQQRSASDSIPSVLQNGSVLDARYAIADLSSKASSTVNFLLYPNATTGSKNTYVNGLYAADAAYIKESGSRTYIQVSEYKGWIDTKNINIVPLSQVVSPSYYFVENGTLYHALSRNVLTNSYSSTLDQGPAPDYLKAGTKYYSYDGHYFYTSMMDLLDDLANGNQDKAVNKLNSFYNYYQFLSHRTYSKYSADDLKNYIETQRGYTAKPTTTSTSQLKNNESQLFGEHGTFIAAQNKYGVNAVLSLGTAINESAWGRSSIALNTNNIYGHNAVDSAPGENANKYDSVSQSINGHAYGFISVGYLDSKDWRYAGPHLGNKNTGMNVHYASDPYWGEKAAHYSYMLDRTYGFQDYGQYNLGYFNTSTAINIRKEPNTTDVVLYNNKGFQGMPVVILGKVTGESVNGSTEWYKIASDMPLTPDRTKTDYSLFYDSSVSYGYVHSSYINTTANVPNVNPDTPTPPKPESKETSGSFHFEKFTANTNGTIDFRGYLVINGQQNRWSDNINYEIIFTNVNTKETITMQLERWTTTSEHPFTIPGEGSLTYAGAWFKGNLDLSKLPQGDYTAQVRADNGAYKTTAMVRNLFSKPQAVSTTNSDGKGVWFRNNYYNKNIPLEIFVRDEGLLSSKKLPTIDNMFNAYKTLDFSGNSLRIRGTSFNVSGDYSGTVTRSIILEHQATFERFTYNAGYIDNGDYEITMRVPDGKSKKRAWFDTTIDLSKLPSGTYTIYVATKVNGVEDFAELNDVFMSALNKTGGTSNQFSLKLNNDRRMRVELVVK